MSIHDFQRHGGNEARRSIVAFARGWTHFLLKRRPSQQFLDDLCSLAPVGTYAAMAEQVLRRSERGSSVRC